MVQCLQRFYFFLKQFCMSAISANFGGVIVNTGGWVRGSGYDSLKHAAGSFEGNI